MTDILLPPGRLVAGSLYNPNTTDFDGNPLVTKTGANAGQPRSEYFFGVAIPKGAEQGWWDTAWGQQIFGTAQAAFPGGETQRPDFAWKITDGDSQVPNKRNVTPASKEGYPGCWVISMSSGFQPDLYTTLNSATPQALVEVNAINGGDYIEVYINVAGNKNPNNPGVYVNHKMVNLVGYGQRISSGPDVSAAGFGGAVAPQGASLTPLASAAPAAIPQQAGAPVAHQPQPGQMPAAASLAAPAQQPAAYAPPAGQPAPQQHAPAAPMQQQPPAAQAAPPGAAAPYAPPTGAVPGAHPVAPPAGNFMAGQPQ